MAHERDRQSNMGGAAVVILLVLLLCLLVLAAGGWFSYLQAGRARRQALMARDALMAAEATARQLQIEAELERDPLLADEDEAESATAEQIAITIDRDEKAMLAQGRPVVIAHRGASGYLPEHTLEAKALAFGMGADFIEQDVVLTKDQQPIVLHDIHLDTVTDVAKRYPDRARKDGRYYALDFTLAEIKMLRVHERVNLRDNSPVFPGRFPIGRSRFEIATLSEEIELIQGLNESTGRRVGIYPEIKLPAWHRKEGHDISTIVLTTLREHGYENKDDPVFLQCFDQNELVRIRQELGTQLRLIQLIADRDDRLRTIQGIVEVSTYADGIGPSLNHIFVSKKNGSVEYTDLVKHAHQNGLLVHPYTFRADSLPRDIASLEELLLIFSNAGVDGVFTDFPDRCVQFFRER